jgi:ubiquitin-activating enzyme E1
VLIVGLRGLGVETAKNLILAGPGAVTLVDDHPTEVKDLGSNFFLTEADVGRPRADAVAVREGSQGEEGGGGGCGGW